MHALRYGLCVIAGIIGIAGASCKSVPTSIDLMIHSEAGVRDIHQLQISLFDSIKRVVHAAPVPQTASSTPLKLPDNVVLFASEATQGPLRVLVNAYGGGQLVAQGTATIEIKSHQQIAGSITVQVPLLADEDSDRVPDVIDRCPHVYDPLQDKPCTGADGAIVFDMHPDGLKRDGGADLLVNDMIQPLDQAGQDQTTGCGCAWGCKSGSTACKQFVPTNNYGASQYAAAVIIQSAQTVSTTTCAFGSKQTGNGGIQACVWAVESFTITISGALSVTGNLPLVILSKGNVAISGLLDVGGHKTIPGPAGGAAGLRNTQNGGGNPGGGTGGGGRCQCDADEYDDCGGGGGGFGQSGGQGGIEGSACGISISAGGVSYGNATLQPLLAGSGGASAGQKISNGEYQGNGGAGGGALQISAIGTIVVDGQINAGGGGGDIGLATEYAEGGGGGGSGGGVLLEGLAISGAGVVAANGGGGGAGRCNDRGCTSPTPGQDGAAQLAASLGGTVQNGCSNGGNGGTGTTLPQAGYTAPQLHGAGGAGGGAGRLYFRWKNHSTTSAPIKISGSYAAGEASAQ